MAQNADDCWTITSIEKLASIEDYKAWYVDITVGLKALGLLGHINGQTRRPDAMDEVEKISEWNRNDTRAVRVLQFTIAKELKTSVFENGWTETTTAQETLKLIRDSAAEVSEATVGDTIRNMFILDPKRFTNMDTFALGLEVRWDQIKSLYPEMTFETFVSLARDGITREAPLYDNNSDMGCDVITQAEADEYLERRELGERKKKGKTHAGLFRQLRQENAYAVW